MEVLRIILGGYAIGMGALCLLGLGMFLMSDEVKTFGLSKACFVAANVWLGGGIVMWAFQSSEPPYARASICLIALLVIAASLVMELRAVDQRKVFFAGASGRHLTADQMGEIGRMASSLPKNINLYVYIPTNDIESQNYGKELWKAFGGKILGSLVHVPSNPDGLTVMAGSFLSTDPGYLGSAIIAVTLVQLGIACVHLNEVTVHRHTIEPNRIDILIGPNPAKP
jgi:hypothetical protein